jgi:hypothetical protein
LGPASFKALFLGPGIAKGEGPTELFIPKGKWVGGSFLFAARKEKPPVSPSFEREDRRQDAENQVDSRCAKNQRALSADCQALTKRNYTGH